MAEEGLLSLSQPNCAICLQQINSKCFAGTCYHEFCYECLVRWSKVKPECPLCKRSLTSIIHNVTEMDKYDVHQVPPVHTPNLRELIRTLLQMLEQFRRLQRSPEREYWQEVNEDVTEPEDHNASHISIIMTDDD